jgi:hypothetical protein
MIDTQFDTNPPNDISVLELAKGWPKIKFSDRRLRRLSVLEQKLLVPPAGRELDGFDMDDGRMKHASNALHKWSWLQRARDKLCQPGLLEDHMFWKHYFQLIAELHDHKESGVTNGATENDDARLADEVGGGAEEDVFWLMRVEKELLVSACGIEHVCFCSVHGYMCGYTCADTCACVVLDVP